MSHSEMCCLGGVPSEWGPHPLCHGDGRDADSVLMCVECHRMQKVRTYTWGYRFVQHLRDGTMACPGGGVGHQAAAVGQDDDWVSPECDLPHADDDPENAAQRVASSDSDVTRCRYCHTKLEPASWDICAGCYYDFQAEHEAQRD